MKLWMSSEATLDVGDDLIKIDNRLIKPCINRLLETIVISDAYDEWAFLSIIMTDEFLSTYPEVVKRRPKKRELEFRLHIDHATFKAAEQQGQIKLVLDALERSVDLMEGLKVSLDTRTKLKGVLDEARRELLSN